MQVPHRAVNQSLDSAFHVVTGTLLSINCIDVFIKIEITENTSIYFLVTLEREKNLE